MLDLNENVASIQICFKDMIIGMKNTSVVIWATLSCEKQWIGQISTNFGFLFILKSLNSFNEWFPSIILYSPNSIENLNKIFAICDVIFSLSLWSMILWSTSSSKSWTWARVSSSLSGLEWGTILARVFLLAASPGQVSEDLHRAR